ncbi:Uncharacterized protein APZ42_003633, partial [Daphnia magna]
MWLALKTIDNQLSRGVVASSSWRLDLIKMLYFIMDRQSIMVPRRGKRITAGKPAKNLTFSESYLG